jgi:orotidine-5'-phosphate decarboxylase
MKRSASSARARVVLALDVADDLAARDLVARVGDHIGGIKIGKELFTRCGPDVVRALDSSALPVFLDLKFHDIPNTVARAVRAAGQLRVRWLSLHTAGGAAMLEAATRARDALPAGQRPLLLGVTVLTSMATNDPEEVIDRALLAQACGLDGAIASPLELRRLRAACGNDFLLVTPGVRPSGAGRDDQARVATPGQAVRDGADYLVVGRPIHAAADPVAAAAAVVSEVASALRQAASSGAAAPDVTARDAKHGRTSREVRLERMLRDSGAFLEGHFVLTSGLHSNRYVQCAKFLQHPQQARRAGVWLAERLRAFEPQVVVSVALGGLVIGQETAAALGVRAMFAERGTDGALRLRRGFELEPGERVAIVDDVCTRGTSVVECENLVRAAGAQPLVVGAIIDRSGGKRNFHMPLESLIRVDANAVRLEQCDACAAGQAPVKPGSRRNEAGL